MLDLDLTGIFGTGSGEDGSGSECIPKSGENREALALADLGEPQGGKNRRLTRQQNQRLQGFFTIGYKIS